MYHNHSQACCPPYMYYGYPYYPWPYYAVPYQTMVCSNCYQPLHLCQCTKPLTSMKLPQELLADGTTPSNKIFVGGAEDVSLSLEYLKTGASPTIKVVITENGSSSTWDITTIPDEYQIKENFSSVSPGAQLALQVTDCTARLRWCEVICC